MKPWIGPAENGYMPPRLITITHGGVNGVMIGIMMGKGETADCPRMIIGALGDFPAAETVPPMPVVKNTKRAAVEVLHNDQTVRKLCIPVRYRFC